MSQSGQLKPCEVNNKTQMAKASKMNHGQASRPTISAIILTKDEENNIVDCLKTISWCDEAIVIDDESRDGTMDFARKAGASVYRKRLNGNFAVQRNFGLGKAKGDWVLFLDADERISQPLRTEILQAIKKEDVRGFKLMRQDVFMGKALKFGETAHVRLIRLAKRGSGVWKRPVHEVWDVQGKRETLTEKILHYPHPTIAQFVDEINWYTQIESKLRKQQGETSCLWETLTFPIAKFVKNYFILFGVLDGFPGLIMAFMMSLHSLCIRVKTMET